ncbi:SCO family protein [Actinocrinis puniceicyclus]|uniref:SCO family protein n=1 Tax=Actinocrinis puniceicyclus TaxID=977794 RepID=A0A8J7WPL5_9ACTN|nr:SCO family protein [Actinocrinis puniceicyclus]MBS2964002.1 SCO family protein [Actinocrinis puniceicyclus]
MTDNPDAARPPRSRRRGSGRRALLAALATACLPLSACTAAGGDTSGAAAPAPGASAGNSAMDIALPQAILNLPLEDSSGHPAALSSFKGKILVINDVMTLCQETCPLDTADLVQAARAVQKAGLGDRVEFLSITIDPQRDTTAQLAAYRRLYAPAPADWAILTGPAQDLATLWHNFGVWIQKVPEGAVPAKNWLTGAPLTYDLNHSDDVFFIDGDGHEQTLLDGPAHVEQGTALPSALRSFLNDNGRQNLDHPGGDAWTTQQALQIVSGLVHKPIPLS